jgi:hypothetical protein
VSRIERWTRQVLETEARKRGIRDVEDHSHVDLARLILRHDTALPRGLRNARRLMGTLFEAAVGVLPAFARGRERNAIDRAAARPARLHAETPLPPPAAAAPAAVSGDAWLEPSRLQAGELHLSWRISEQAAQRARKLLGVTGELAVRVVSVRADPARVVATHVTEHGPISEQGEWTMQLESESTHCVSAIGVRSGNRFVSIVHERSAAIAEAAL